MQKLTRTLAMAGALAFAGVLAGCGDDVTVAPDPSITVTPPSATLAVGQSVTFSATVAGLSNKAVTWSTSDQAKATVDGSGKVTAVAAGVATITASAGTGTATPVSASALVTITGKGVTKVDVDPKTDILAPGSTRQLVANVTADPGVARTVTWASSATNVATVSASGVVTAVAPGNASITAASTVDPSVTGAMALTVRDIQKAQISIQAVTKGGTTQPVNFNNVTGQIDVVLNVDPGEERVTKVDVNLDGKSACTRNLSASESDALRMAAAFESVEAVDIVCSINTADFSKTTGAVTFLNGAHTLSASGTIAGPPARTITATDQAITLNNASGFIADVTNTNTNTGFPNSAINTTTGQNWVSGDVTLKLTAVNYTAGGATVAGVSGGFFGKTFTNVAPAAGTQVFTIVFPNSGATALNVVGYQSPVVGGVAAGELPSVSASILSTGNAGPTTILNDAANAPGLGLTPVPVTRLDNMAPAAAATNTGFPTWVNATFAFTPTAIYAAGADAGVDAVKTDFYYIGGSAALPTAGGACDVTGMTKVTKGSDLAETIISSYRPRAVSYDALGNKTCADMSVATGTPFGADFTAPANVTFAGVADLAAFNSTATASGTNYVLASTGDNASGISATTPGLVSIVRVNSTGANTCVVGGTPTATCPQIAAAGTASITGGSTGEGYYTLTAQMTDNAANVAPTAPFIRTFLVDATAPSFTGNVGMAAQYSGNAPAAFSNLLITDNLDLAKLFGRVAYTNLGNLQYADQAIGAFGLPLEKSFSGTYTIPSLIRCINAANDFTAQAGSEATQATFFAVDQAGNQGTVSPVAGALQAALDNCGAVGNLTAPATITAFADSAVNYGTGKTQVSIAGTTTTVNAASVGLTAITTVTLDNSPEPFTRVEFYYEQSAGNWVKIGQSGPGVLNQTVTTRTWTYKFTWDPDATVPVNATTNVIALGIDAQGDAVRTAGVVVNVAP